MKSSRIHRIGVQTKRVENNRIQKLLLSEYSEFSEMVLVESSFAETTRNGRGLRQVSLALTPSKLIVAADVLKNDPDFLCPPGLDPSIESFELVSVYPLEYVTLSVFGRRRRRILKARLIDGRARYYELGGTQRNKIFWAIWCEHVRNLLSKKMDGSSLSETTAASSSSSSTLYILSSEVEIENEADEQNRKKFCRVWAHYAGAGDCATPTWLQKDLFLGESYNELWNGTYAPMPIRFAGASLEDVGCELEDRSLVNGSMNRSCSSWPPCQISRNSRKFQRNGELCDVLFFKDRYASQICHTNKIFYNCKCSNYHEWQPCLCINEFNDSLTTNKNNQSRRSRISTELKSKKSNYRNESKANSLFPKISRFGFGVPEKCNSGLVLGPYRSNRAIRNPQNFHQLMENSVVLWESKRKSLEINNKKHRHLRRYGVSTASHFLFALGPWSVRPGERDSVQGHRSNSVVNIRRQPTDPEIRLPISRRQLAASISCTSLEPGKCNSIGIASKGRVLLFWTPEYWYRPRAATAAYKELRRHLGRLKNFQANDKQRKRLFSKHRQQNQSRENFRNLEAKSSSLLSRIFSGTVPKKNNYKKEEHNHPTSQLRKLLRMDIRITVWDLDSDTLAEQLTTIDRDLFIRIPAKEIEILIFQKSSKNAPNFGAWIAFSHRISCLTTSEILSIKKLEMRARIIARFINSANKCFAMGNFQSCRSILSGLQAPPIYRLKMSWSYLRIHHASRYETMEKLCKVYKNPRTPAFRKAWSKTERSPPYIPYVGDVLVRLLDLLNGPNNMYIRPHKKRKVHKFSAAPIPQRRIFTISTNPINNTCSLPNRHYDNLDSKKNAENESTVFKKILSSFGKAKDNTKEKKGGNEQDHPWTAREYNLARKFVDKWNYAILKSKLYSEDQKKFKNMDPRREHFLQVASWLADCQRFAQQYHFQAHSFAREFLLKARYKEDRENFFISLKLEPPKATG